MTVTMIDGDTSNQQRADGQQLTIVHCGCLFNFTLLTLVRLDRMPTGAI